MASVPRQAAGCTWVTWPRMSFHGTKSIGGEERCSSTTRSAASWRSAPRSSVEKGTNRSKFFRGEVDKYTWVATGSSYLPSELCAAVLDAQLQEAQWITDCRQASGTDTAKPSRRKSARAAPGARSFPWTASKTVTSTICCRPWRTHGFHRAHEGAYSVATPFHYSALALGRSRRDLYAQWLGPEPDREPVGDDTVPPLWPGWKSPGRGDRRRDTDAARGGMNLRRDPALLAATGLCQAVPIHMAGQNIPRRP